MITIKKYTYLLSSIGLQQSIMTILGNGAAQTLSAVALIIISRILGPQNFGIFSAGFSLVLILSRVNEMGLNTAILKYASSSNSKKERNDIYSMTLKYKLIISFIISIVGVVFANSLAGFMNLGDPLIITAVFTIGLANVYYEQLLTILQSLRLFFQTVVINIIQASFKLFSVIVLFFLASKSVLPIFISYIIAPFLPLLFVKWLLPKSFNINFGKFNSKLREKVLKLTKHSAVALISAGIIENIDVLFLQKHLSSYETGLYGGALRVSLAFALIAYSLSNVLFPRVARYKNKKDLKIYLQKAIGVVMLSTLGFLAFIPLAKTVLLLTIGPEYISSLPILLILSLASFLAIASVPFMALFYTFNANWYFSISGIAQLLITLVGNYFFVPIYGMEAAAWTKLGTRLFLLLFTAGMGAFLYWKNYEKTTK